RDMGVDRMCIDPKPACTPGPGMCDPTCRTGCPLCDQKCSINTAGALTCNVPYAQSYPKALGQNCTIASSGTVDQTDNCGPGLVCVEDGCFPRCYQFCKSNADCVGSACTRDVGGGQKVCDVAFMDACSPLQGDAA